MNGTGDGKVLLEVLSSHYNPEEAVRVAETLGSDLTPKLEGKTVTPATRGELSKVQLAKLEYLDEDVGRGDEQKIFVLEFSNDSKRMPKSAADLKYHVISEWLQASCDAMARGKSESVSVVAERQLKRSGLLTDTAPIFPTRGHNKQADDSRRLQHPGTACQLSDGGRSSTQSILRGLLLHKDARRRADALATRGRGGRGGQLGARLR